MLGELSRSAVQAANGGPVEGGLDEGKGDELIRTPGTLDAGGRVYGQARLVSGPGRAYVAKKALPSTPEMLGGLVSREDVARLLGIAISTMPEGTSDPLPPTLDVGRECYWRKDELMAWASEDSTRLAVINRRQQRRGRPPWDVDAEAQAV